MAKRILIVDDSPTVRMFEVLTLRAQGYAVFEATNGVEALAEIARHPPDLVLLDVVMPDMDGIECCRRIKSNWRTKHIGVVMLTTRGKPDQMDEAYDAGCDDYLTKPVSRVALTTKVRRLLSES